MTEFESSDLYFQPDDPAVLYPDSFSPQQRLRNFLPSWATASKQHLPQHDQRHLPCPSSRSTSVRFHSQSSSSSSTTSPFASRYLISATGDHTTTTTTTTTKTQTISSLVMMPPPLLPVPFFSESPESLAGTSASSGESQEVKERDEEDDLESYCGSLTYSVESEFKYHRPSPISHADQQHFFPPPPSSVSTHTDDIDLYEDAVENLDESTTDDDFLHPERSSTSKKRRSNDKECFPFQHQLDGNCFAPLAWIGTFFRPKNILVVDHEMNDRQ
jgi:hypothetical protein